ncbi:C39 family peptidase [Patescibacteria group bacterium]|nr:C39 family peptidase [Patescibacteria group bacterium]
MKLRTGVLLGCALCILVAGYYHRGVVRAEWRTFMAPSLPNAQKFKPTPSTIIAGGTAAVEGGVATSSHFVLVSSPDKVPTADPFGGKTVLPGEVNLDVPFTSQAPFSDWSMPYQEACEEASMIMVDAFYRGITRNISPSDAKTLIDSIVAFEEKTIGGYKDTSAQQTADIMKGYFGYADVRVLPYSEVNMRRALANGYPVIVPADGKILPNPNFRNGGPPYHMVVVKGYLKDRWITNDPGTYKGKDFTYSFADLAKAAHDWNGGDVAHGKAVMLIALPKE